MFSKIVWKNRRKVPAAAVRVEDRSTVEDRLPRNSCRQICCVFVARACFRMSLDSDLSGRRPALDRRWQLSARYAGAAPASDWCTSPAILNATCWRTGSQCSCRSTGVMWSLRRAPVTRRAAAFTGVMWSLRRAPVTRRAAAFCTEYNAVKVYRQNIIMCRQSHFLITATLQDRQQ